MTANHEHTPTRHEFRALLNTIMSGQYGKVANPQSVLEDFDKVIAAAEQRGAERAFRKTQEIIAGFEHTIDEARNRGDMINAGYLIQELDTEIQNLTEDDDVENRI